jgi:hypothetical protein
MNVSICKCGHKKVEHLDFIDRLDAKRNRHYREYVAMGFGKCQKCDCDYFKK